MKKLFAYFLVFCLFFCLSACAGSQGEAYTLNEHGLPVISESLRNKLNSALKEHDQFGFTETYLDIWGSEEDYEAAAAGRIGLAIRYYGNYDGYDIVFFKNRTPVQIEAGLQIEEYLFEYGTPFSIIGHKDGVTYGLEELYENGKISKESLGKIYQCHLAFDSLKYGLD